MIDTLGAALQNLKDQIQHEPAVVPIFTRGDLEARFHGLNVSQVAKLVDAPALSCIEPVQTAQGEEIQRVLIDGLDDQRKAQVIHQLLVDHAGSPNSRRIQEIVLLQGGVPRGSFVRDRNDVVYRVDDRRAVIDDALTAAVRQAHQQDGPVRADAGNLYRRPIVIRDPIAFSAMIGKALEAIGELHEQQQAAEAALMIVARATGETDVDRAIDSAGPEALRSALRQMHGASKDSDRILKTLSGAAATLVGIANKADTLHPLADTLQAARP